MEMRREASPEAGFWAVWASGTLLLLIADIIALSTAEGDATAAAWWILLAGATLCLINISTAIVTSGYTTGDAVPFGKNFAIITGWASIALAVILLIISIIVIIVVVIIAIMVGVVMIAAAANG